MTIAITRSVSYYITLFVIKIKGIKKVFSQSPIDYLRLRKDDVFFPKNKFFKSENISVFSVLKTKITQINSTTSQSEKLLIYFHGGAFVSGPAQHHWDSIERISKGTKFNIWVCNYPKAPESNIEEISTNIDSIYQKALLDYKSENIIVMGDSVGGTLTIALTQRLISNNINLPLKIILISPVLDASFTNKKINEIEAKDPMLSKAGVLSAKKMCSENLKDERISPIYGDFKFFPKTYLYIAEYDITNPDQLIFISKLKEEKIEHIVCFGNGMPHIWPLLPVMKESKNALNEILNIINQ